MASGHSYVRPLRSYGFMLMFNAMFRGGWSHSLLEGIVVLSVATSKDASSQMFGLAIGSCVTVGGNAIGGNALCRISIGITTLGARISERNRSNH